MPHHALLGYYYTIGLLPTDAEGLPARAGNADRLSRDNARRHADLARVAAPVGVRVRDMSRVLRTIGAAEAHGGVGRGREGAGFQRRRDEIGRLSARKVNRPKWLTEPNIFVTSLAPYLGDGKRQHRSRRC